MAELVRRALQHGGEDDPHGDPHHSGSGSIHGDDGYDDGHHGYDEEGEGDGGWTAIITLLLLAFCAYTVYLSIRVVHEKEVMIVERLGRFHAQLNAGVHFLFPFVDWPKNYHFRYAASDTRGEVDMVEKKSNLISTKDEVIDFPRQQVITRDNAMIYLDAILNYKITSPKTMIYAVQNLPHMLSKLLQAQVRNVAGTLDVDQVIEDTAAMDAVGGLMDFVTSSWGVKINFVKIQKVEAADLTKVLAKKKEADLKNKEVIIQAKMHKQTLVIESEGQRDRMIKEAEGEAQQMLSRARGQAQAIVNAANAEARAVKEIARAIQRGGENPTKYLLSLKYIDALKRVTLQRNTEVQFLPHNTAFLQTVQELGMNTVMPPRA